MPTRCGRPSNPRVCTDRCHPRRATVAPRPAVAGTLGSCGPCGPPPGDPSSSVPGSRRGRPGRRKHSPMAGRGSPQQAVAYEVERRNQDSRVDGSGTLGERVQNGESRFDPYVGANDGPFPWRARPRSVSPPRPDDHSPVIRRDPRNSPLAGDRSVPGRPPRGWRIAERGSRRRRPQSAFPTGCRRSDATFDVLLRWTPACYVSPSVSRRTRTLRGYRSQPGGFGPSYAGWRGSVWRSYEVTTTTPISRRWNRSPNPDRPSGRRP